MNHASKSEKQQLDQFNLNKTTKDLANASKQRTELANESREIYDAYYDKILLYSAGAFSFSLALIGLVVRDNTEALAHTGFLFPNIYWLYGSLFLYLIVCGLILISKRFDALYTAAIGTYFYVKNRLSFEKASIDFHKSYFGNVLVKNSSSEQEIKTSKDNLEKLKVAKAKTDRDSNQYHNLKRFSHLGAELLASVATILLFFFFVQIIQATIWG